MSRRARIILGLVLAVVVAGIASQVPAAAGPVAVPPPGPCPRAPALWSSPCPLPAKGAVVEWPGGDHELWGGPRSFVLPAAGPYVLWTGDTSFGFPLFWHDVGSGFPVAPTSGPYQFPLAGVYSFECAICFGIARQKMQGTMYVIGPRAIVSAKLISADNSGTAITYGFDAAGSFVTDHEPVPAIVQYAFDFQDDGTFDQVSPEPAAQASLTPGPHTVRVRVTDSTGRTGDWPLFLEVPYVRPGNPEPNPVADIGASGDLRTGVRFDKTKIKVRAAKRIRRIVLRRRGLSVKVSGLTKGDRIRARLLKGKRSLVASGSGTSTGSSKTVRLRVGRSGKRILGARPRPRRLVLDVAVEGTDGFQITKRLAVRVSS